MSPGPCPAIPPPQPPAVAAPVAAPVAPVSPCAGSTLPQPLTPAPRPLLWRLLRRLLAPHLLPLVTPAAPAVPVTTAPAYTLDQISRAGASLVDAGKMQQLLEVRAAMACRPSPSSSRSSMAPLPTELPGPWALRFKEVPHAS